MKRIVTMMAAAILPLWTLAWVSDNDSVVIHKPQKVTIITGDSIQKIIVKGKEGNDNFEYSSMIQLVDSNYVSNVEINKDSWNLKSIIPPISMTKCSNDSTHSAELALGGDPLIGFTAPTHTASGTDFSTFSSWEIAVPFLACNYYFDKKKRAGFSLNMYLDWRNYRMTGDMRFVKNEKGNVELSPYPEGVKPKFSRIKVFSVSSALLFNTFFSKKWGLALGPVVNFNTYASIKTRYSKDGVKFKEVNKHINQRKVTFDMMGIIFTPEVDLYLKYSPNNVLKDGVKFRSLTFGLYL